MSLGKRVTELRLKKGFNQKELADASGITQATISRIESEQVHQLKSEALKRLAKALGVTVDYLVGKTDKLSANDIVRSDTTAEYIFRGYEKLSGAQREKLKSFVHFLEEEEKKGGKGKR